MAQLTAGCDQLRLIFGSSPAITRRFHLAPYPPLVPETPTISITVNGQSVSIPADATIASLLLQLNLAGQPAAVERNGRLVPKRLHEKTTLEPSDKLEIVTLVGGG